MTVRGEMTWWWGGRAENSDRFGNGQIGPGRGEFSNSAGRWILTPLQPNPAVQIYVDLHQLLASAGSSRPLPHATEGYSWEGDACSLTQRTP